MDATQAQLRPITDDPPRNGDVPFYPLADISAEEALTMATELAQAGSSRN